MKGISVEYVDHMGSDLSIVNSARVSFSKTSEVLDERDKRLVSFLGREQHTTPFRHNAISIRCRAPIFIARQLGKHQVGLSWNEVSRRYVDDEPEFFYPESWRSRPSDNIKQGSGSDLDGVLINLIQGTSDTVDGAYRDYVCLIHEMYDQFLEEGVAPEQARMLLPQSMITEWIWTGSLMAFAHVYNLRIDGHAQIEVQAFAKELDKVIQPLFPVGWAALKEEK